MKRIISSILFTLFLTVLSFSQQTATTPSVTIKVNKVSALTISVPATIPPANIVGVVSQPYGPLVFPVTGGTAPYTCTVASGSLPAGLSVTSTPVGCSVAGTPLATAADGSFSLKATDSTSLTATVTLQWQASPSPPATVSGYKVGFSPTNGGPYTTFVTTANNVLIAKRTVPKGKNTIEFYVVNPFNSAGSAANSNQVQVNIP